MNIIEHKTAAFTKMLRVARIPQTANRNVVYQ